MPLISVLIMYSVSLCSHSRGGMYSLGSQHKSSAGWRWGWEEGVQEKGQIPWVWPIQGAQRWCEVRGLEIINTSTQFDEVFSYPLSPDNLNIFSLIYLLDITISHKVKTKMKTCFTKLSLLFIISVFILSTWQCEASPWRQQAAVLQRPEPSQIPETQSSSAWGAKSCGDG